MELMNGIGHGIVARGELPLKYWLRFCLCREIVILKISIADILLLAAFDLEGVYVDNL